MRTKFIVVVGTLLSGLGKGGITSSILKMLDLRGYRALPLKFDGYLNYDCGTMNPFRHGEVFVLDDKSEVDMDFGMYERFLNRSLTGNLSITGGKLFSSVIEKERRGEYLGEDVQIIPHLTNEIIGRIEAVAAKERPDVLVIEVGGTVGDIENSYFIEAMRQMSSRHDVAFVNLTYVPEIDAVGEQKTKPTQIGVRSLMQLGIRPDVIVCRSEKPLLERTKEKIALYAGVDRGQVIDDSTQHTVYGLPGHFMAQGMDRMLLERLGVEPKSVDRGRLAKWNRLVGRTTSPNRSICIALVGKYTTLKDAYASVTEALVHAGVANNVRVNVKFIDSTDFEGGAGNMAALEGVDGVVVPGGFGKRGIEGMIAAIRHCREMGIPYLGLCLGMQLMVVEYARNVCGLRDANSSEFEKNPRHNVIDLMAAQRGVKRIGGSMRLGLWPARVKRGTKTYEAYGSGVVKERHRHRYEVNNSYRKILEKHGLIVSATTVDGQLVETVEWSGTYGIGTQAHPEFTSRLESPNPLFVDFVKRSSLHGDAHAGAR